MAMSSFDKDMNIIQKLNDEPNDRDGLTAGELKAKFDEGGLAVKGYLNNTVRPYVNDLDDDKYDKTGGTLSGNVIVVQDDAVAPGLQLKGQEKSGVGRASTTINKNASAASDGGTQIIDYNWGATDQLRLIVQATAAAMKEKVRLYYKEGAASVVTYYLYGTHNPPAVVDVTGLQAALDAKQDALTFDNLPTSGSENPVESGGVYTALADKYDKVGGTLTGNVTIQKDSLPSVALKSAAKENVGQAQTMLQKNASATTDGGTILFDYTWGNLDYVRMYLKASAATTKELLYLYYKPESGSAVKYYLYGTHNPPGIADVTGLQAALDGKYVTAGKKSGTTLGTKATAEGQNTTASSNYSHAEGIATTASGNSSHAEGNTTTASGNYSHAEGEYATASGARAHAEGSYTTASNDFSHAEGQNTTASGFRSHAEGRSTEASGDCAHAEGYLSKASGDYSHAEGQSTIAAGKFQHVFGKYNVEDPAAAIEASGYIEIVGNGVSSSRSNARTLDWSGNEWIAGTLTQASDARLKDVQGEVPDVSGIRAVRFRWNDQKGEHDEKDHIGYLAQDVEQVAPYLVGKDSSGYKSLDYIAFLCAKIEGLERRVAELESR